MAATLSRPGIRRIVLTSVIAGIGSDGLAQSGGPDPLRPPEHLLERRAPTAAAASAAAACADPATFPLQAILFSASGGSRVLVDGWLYREGDRINGCRVAAIGRERVDLDVNGKRVRVGLTPQVITTPRPLAEDTSHATPSSAAPARSAQRRPKKETP